MYKKPMPLGPLNLCAEADKKHISCRISILSCIIFCSYHFNTYRKKLEIFFVAIDKCNML